MIKVGLTGSIGSGKTLVSRIFSSLGISVYQADKEAKKFLLNPEVKNHIIKITSQKVIGKNGEVDTKILSDIVFSDSLKLSVLNQLIHPFVREDFHNWLRGKGDEPYIIHEAAILFESGFYADFDKVIVVTAPENVRIQRVMERDGVTRDDVLARIKYQWSDKKKKKYAGFVVVNDGRTLIIPQVLKIHDHLLK